MIVSFGVGGMLSNWPIVFAAVVGETERWLKGKFYGVGVMLRFRIGMRFLTGNMAFLTRTACLIYVICGRT